MATDSVVPAPDAATTLPPGTRLGKYEVGRRLGAGGMGTVYEAVHLEIGKRVAVKVLAPAVAAMEGARARFLREAQLTSKVRHMHAVDVTDMGTEGDHSYLVMELLSGEDLATRLARGGRMDPHELVDVVLAVCSAVAAAHRAGIIHRDLKPQNIFLAEGPHGLVPKVLDFGISKGLDASTARALTSTGSVLGTPYYLAPEQVVDNRASSPLSDQYAIGIILYECLTSARPFEGESLFMVFQAIVAGSPIPPRALRPELDPGLEAVVLRAIEAEPTRRFPSVEDLGRALWRFASERSRMLWRDAFGPLAPGAAGAPARRPMGGETALDSTPRSATPPRRPPTPAARTPGGPIGDHTPSPPLRASSRRIPALLGVLALAAAAVVAYRFLRPDDDGGRRTREAPEAANPTPAAPVAPPPPRSYAAAVIVEPPTARIELDGAVAGQGRFERTFPLDGADHTLVISAEGFDTRSVSFRDAPPPARITLVARPREVPPKPPAARPASRTRRERPARKETAPAGPRPPASNADDAPIVD
jgi:eukaryotic-like serine/threonine-protein kinase